MGGKMRSALTGWMVGLLVVFMGGVCFGKGNDNVIANGKKVTFDYTLKVDGKVIDSSQQHGSLVYTQGEGKIIPGLSRQLEGLRAGDEKEIVVTPQEGYGAVDPKAFKEVPREQLPKDAKLKVGTQLQAKTPDGHILVVTVSKLNKDTVLLNFNHPLAGKELHFQVKILSIQ